MPMNILPNQGVGISETVPATLQTSNMFSASMACSISGLRLEDQYRLPGSYWSQRYPWIRLKGWRREHTTVSAHCPPSALFLIENRIQIFLDRPSPTEERCRHSGCLRLRPSLGCRLRLRVDRVIRLVLGLHSHHTRPQAHWVPIE